MLHYHSDHIGNTHFSWLGSACTSYSKRFYQSPVEYIIANGYTHKATYPKRTPTDIHNDKCSRPFSALGGNNLTSIGRVPNFPTTIMFTCIQSTHMYKPCFPFFYSSVYMHTFVVMYIQRLKIMMPFYSKVLVHENLHVRLLILYCVQL